MHYNRNWLYLVIWILFVGFVFKPMLFGKVPIPLDVMVGGYYPWLDYKWGYPAGIPYKNTSLTDVFSQLFSWRILAIDGLRSGNIPLWNPYSFAGMPLLANWQSAVLYPFNIFMFIFGNVWGWSVMVMLQPFLAGIFFYLMLRVHKIPRFACFGGGAVFAFSGFMTTYMQYNTTGQIFLWLPLLLIIAVKQKYLWFAPWIIYNVITGGFFQPMFYTLIISSVYWYLNKVPIKKIFLYFGLGVMMGTAQLIPTAELLVNSVRNYDPNINNYNFGLMPGKLMLTFLAPDFFGNPVTGNYFGFMGYQETSGYAGLLSLVLLFAALKYKRSPLKISAYIFLLAGLTLAFDNPISRLIYEFKIPLISTGYASRNLLFLSFSMAVITALGLTQIDKMKRWSLILLSILAGIALGYVMVLRILTPDIAKEYIVSFRNLMIPVFLISAINLTNYIKLNSGLKISILLGILFFDLGRYAVKFLPFSEARFANLKIPSIEFIQDNVGNLRIERDKATLPPNTWQYFKLRTPSGYDPLVPLEYAKLYSVYSHGELGKSGFSRYAETENWDSPLLDLLGVKYVLTTKKIGGVIDKDGSDAGYKFDNSRYKTVFADNISLVLENTAVMKKYTEYDEYDVIDGDMAFASLSRGYDFKNKIILDRKPDFDPGSEKILLVNESYFPGWKAWINGKETEIFKAFGALQAIVVPKSGAKLDLHFMPISFQLGLLLTLLVIGILGIMKWRQGKNGSTTLLNPAE